MWGNEIPIDDRSLTPEEEARVERLSESQLIEIDNALLSNAKPQWRKVAMVVAVTMSSLSNRVPGIPDVFYGMRVRKLVEDGVLESQGNLAQMRFSEVCLRAAIGVIRCNLTSAFFDIEALQTRSSH